MCPGLIDTPWLVSTLHQGLAFLLIDFLVQHKECCLCAARSVLARSTEGKVAYVRTVYINEQSPNHFSRPYSFIKALFLAQQSSSILGLVISGAIL